MRRGLGTERQAGRAWWGEDSGITSKATNNRNGYALGTGCLGMGLGIRAGMQNTGLFLPRELDGWVFVELDVGSEGNADGAQIQEVLHTVVSRGSIGSYVTSPRGFQFRRLGTGEPDLQTGLVPPVPLTAMGSAGFDLRVTGAH